MPTIAVQAIRSSSSRPSTGCSFSALQPTAAPLRFSPILHRTSWPKHGLMRKYPAAAASCQDTAEPDALAERGYGTATGAEQETGAAKQSRDNNKGTPPSSITVMNWRHSIRAAFEDAGL